MEQCNKASGNGVNVKNQIFNPYLPSCEYIPDGEPRVFEDRLYIYMEVMINLMEVHIVKMIMCAGQHH